MNRLYTSVVQAGVFFKSPKQNKTKQLFPNSMEDIVRVKFGSAQIHKCLFLSEAADH